MIAAPLKIGFLGAGQMATALARGWISAGWLTPETALASDPFAEARTRFSSATGIVTVQNNREVVQKCDWLILAVKPQMMSGLISEICSEISDSHRIVSIAAGITLKTLGEGLGFDRRIIRVMPNTPALVSACAAGYAQSPSVTEEDSQQIRQLLDSVGRAYRVAEPLLDAVTGLSGSGPAFVCLMIEALSDGGVRMGLPREVATILAAQTLLGTAKMVLETRQHPAQLKDGVASPGGTTIAGLHELESGGVRGALMDAVRAATLRATELGKMG